MMRHVFGMIAFALAMFAFFSPQEAIYTSGSALVIASLAAYRGEKLFSLTAPLVVAANVFYFNPQIVTMINKSKDVLVLWVLVILFLATPFVAAALHASGAFDFRERAKHH
jgi:hypothetical protein